MTLNHPLDRPVWSALTTAQSHLALGDDRALRFEPGYAIFGAARTFEAGDLRALAALKAPPDGLATVEAPGSPQPDGEVVLRLPCVQMICEAVAPGGGAAFEPLTEADAPAMRALAELTRPGPFFARTHQLGDFIGVKADGRLIAMAGERMRVAGFTEVSGVCTHPDARGRGLAAALTRIATARIHARGEAAFLHAVADHAATIRLYESLGYRVRARLDYTVFAAPRG